jgi:hypothetical protein
MKVNIVPKIVCEIFVSLAAAFIVGFFVFALFGCASTPSQKAAIEYQEKENIESKALVESSNLTPIQKAKVTGSIDNSLSIARRAETRADESEAAKEKAEKKIESLTPYKFLVWGACGTVLLAALGLGGFWFFKRYLSSRG